MVAARTARKAADELEVLAHAMARGDLVGAITALTRAMAAFAALEGDLVQVRDAGLVATAALKPTGSC
jgi:hypothetical protein